MNINQLMEKSLNHAILRENGASETVDYVHYLTRDKESVQCFPQNINDGELSKDADKSYVTFHGLFLEEIPSRGDAIEWNNDKYHYEKTMSQLGDSYYDVLAYKSIHSPRGRR